MAQKKKFNGKVFTLEDVGDSPRDAKNLAEKYRKKGYLVRVELRRYSPPRGAEFNMWYVWVRRK